ncbi:MAG TPA: hypothetical protein VFC19_27160 [Candidatus Limnocylindrales bacterium]|nr:hypothetical protein [Candidatus Limnocylindrales bacterium]
MDARDLIATACLPEKAGPIVADYLSRLDAVVPLPASERERILAEAADALVCATQARIAIGESPAAAASAAVAEFGDPVVLAKQFADALGPGMARRVGLMLISSGPVVGLVWVAAIGSGAGWGWRVGSALAAMPLLPVVLAFSVPAAAVAALAGLSPLRLEVLSRAVPRAARLATFGCVCADALLIASTAGHLASGSLGFSGWVACAAVLSMLRLTLAATAFQRLRRLSVAGC